MTSMVDIDEGNTNSFVLHAIIVLILSIPGFFIHLILGGALLAIGLSIFATRNGIQIDLANHRYRKYANYMGWKMGSWEALDNIVEARIVLSSESGQLQNALYMGRATVDLKALTYDLVVSDGITDGEVMYEFLSYKDAKRALKTFADNGISCVDQIKEKLVQNQRRRRR